MISSNEIQEIASIMEHLEMVPYDVTRKQLYTPEQLYEGFDPDEPESYQNCLDTRVYQHFLTTGKQVSSIEESLARTLHDHGMHVAMQLFFQNHDHRCCVGIMGGHALLRTDPLYREIVLLSKRLTEQGFTLISGGGPGAMEATHLGAWMAGRSMEETEEAMRMLMDYPSFKDDGWLVSAFKVIRRFPQRYYQSLGIPTWLYGHEPSTPFATHIAKFFENSLREDSILTLAYGGIIYAPGSAGTMQEIFQDAVQNHYLSFGFSSPMIFLGKHFWTNEMPAYTLLKGLMDAGKYQNLLLTLTDDANEIVTVLHRFRQCETSL